MSHAPVVELKSVNGFSRFTVHNRVFGRQIIQNPDGSGFDKLELSFQPTHGKEQTLFYQRNLQMAFTPGTDGQVDLLISFVDDSGVAIDLDDASLLIKNVTAQPLLYFFAHIVPPNDYWTPTSHIKVDGTKDAHLQKIWQAVKAESEALLRYGVKVENGKDYNIITGTQGDDTLTGSAGDDVIIGRAGNDTLTGGVGEDRFIFELTEGAEHLGHDTITDHESGELLYFGNASHDEIVLRVHGLDIYRQSAPQDIVISHPHGTVTLSDINLGQHIFRIIDETGAVKSGTFLELGGYKVKQGWSTQDSEGYLYSTHFNDEFHSGPGRDRFYFDPSRSKTANLGDDVIYGFASGEMLHFEGADFAELDIAFKPSGIGTKVNAVITHPNGSVTLMHLDPGSIIEFDTKTGREYEIEVIGQQIGTGAADILTGSDAQDVITGGAGRDALHGQADNDKIYGNMGIDKLYGGDGDDYLHGGSGDDYLQGGAGDDVLFGGSGDDRLVGHSGNDTLTGGSGQDVFIFRKDFGNDVITDFSSNDTLRLGAYRANELSAQLIQHSDDLYDLVIRVKGKNHSVTLKNLTTDSVIQIVSNGSELSLGDIFDGIFDSFGNETSNSAAAKLFLSETTEPVPLDDIVNPSYANFVSYEFHPFDRPFYDANGVAFKLTTDYGDNALFTINDKGHLLWKETPDYDKPLDIGKDNTYQVQIERQDADGETHITNLDIDLAELSERRIVNPFLFRQNLSEAERPSEAASHLISGLAWKMPDHGPLIVSWALLTSNHDTLDTPERVAVARSILGAAFKEYATYTNIEFVETEPEFQDGLGENWKFDTHLTIHFSSEGGFNRAEYPYPNGHPSRVNFTTTHEDNYAVFNFVMHELGHALGLKHPNTPSFAPGWLINNNIEFNDETEEDDGLFDSITSYEAQTDLLTPADIEALQYLYGVKKQEVDIDENHATDSAIYTVPALYKVLTQGGGVRFHPPSTETTVTSPQHQGTYSLSDDFGDNELFRVDENGDLFWKQSPDYENPLDEGGDNIYDVEILFRQEDKPDVPSDGALVKTHLAVEVFDIVEVPVDIA